MFENYMARKYDNDKDWNIITNREYNRRVHYKRQRETLVYATTLHRGIYAQKIITPSNIRGHVYLDTARYRPLEEFPPEEATRLLSEHLIEQLHDPTRLPEALEQLNRLIAPAHIAPNNDGETYTVINQEGITLSTKTPIADLEKTINS